MQFENIGGQLSKIIKNSIDADTQNWLAQKLKKIVDEQSTRDLYMTYSLIGTKVDKDGVMNIEDAGALKAYIEIQNGNIQQIARIYLLATVLDEASDFFVPKVANLIQVADTSELETFLKFLILLPNPENYKDQAVDALRTNIATIFNAIAFHNPYPALYFNEQQWNQMYLKTAFMQGDLSAIMDIDKRANKELTRIIADYAHERWAASREIDPYFWRPVAKFLDDNLLLDMKRLLASANLKENYAAALCLFNSDNDAALELLNAYPQLVEKVKNKTISWNSLKD